MNSLIHKMTSSPALTLKDQWNSDLSSNQNVPVKPKQLYHHSNRMYKEQNFHNKTIIRFVCMSDTHSKTEEITFDIPDGDIFIHAGDFTRYGLEKEVEKFNTWMGELPHQHKIVIAGNHDEPFDEYFMGRNTASQMRALLTNVTYLEDSAIVIEGIKIYGTPWQPEYRGGAFNIPRGRELMEKWNLIPDDTDVLVTHTPPAGQGDMARNNVRAGCAELLTSVEQRIKPKYHVFGHIHEGYGITTNGTTTFINAATCSRHFVPENKPIVFDFDISKNSGKKGTRE